MSSVRSRDGLSLVEILIAIAVIGILAAVVIPRGDASLREQLISTAQIVASDLAYARSMAVANDSKYQIAFEISENRYYLQHSGTNTALNTLPVRPFSSNLDTKTRQYIDLDDLPHVGAAVRLLAVAAATQTQMNPITQMEFGSLGELTGQKDIIVWLSAGSGSAQRYVPLTVNKVTGLVTVGTFSGYGPPAGIIVNTSPVTP